MPVFAYAGAATPAALPIAAAAGNAAPVAPEPAPYLDLTAGRDGRLLDRKAGVLVATAIGLGGVMQLIAVGLGHHTSIEPDTLIRYDLVLTLGLYAVVAAMIVSQITPSVRLRWGDGPLALRIGIGAGAGIGISLLLLALISGVAGHVQTDPRIVLLMSAGDPTHIIVTFFLACVAAPLVEETLFRGLLLESLRPRGKAVAIIVSAGAFAVWHFMPSSLIYYAALGAALGRLYLKRGLASSIAAHVGFNGVLTLAALSIVLGPSHLVRVAGLSLTAPSGWSVATSQVAQLTGANAVVVGPSGAELEIIPGPSANGVSPDAIAQRLANAQIPAPPGMSFDTSSVETLPVPAGQVVELPITVLGRHGTLAFLAADGQSYELVFFGAGSVKAQNDFTRMLASLQVN